MLTDLDRFKRRYYGAISQRTGIPLEYYLASSLPPAALAKFHREQREKLDARRMHRLMSEEYHGECSVPVVSLRPRCRRPVGDTSLREDE